MEKVISVEQLTKIFDSQTVAVNGISFNIYENHIFGLLGPNGSGKTTIQRMLATILEPTSGIIKYYNRKLGGGYTQKIREKIGYVPQRDCLYKELNIYENMDIFSRPYKLEKAKRLKNINSLLEKLGLAEKKNVLVRNLSGGFAKRASIATALVHEPKILFLDEVTMGLDPNSRYYIWDLVKELKQQTTIILTTHYMDEAESLCDKIAILSEGTIFELDKPENIIKKFKAEDLDEVIKKIIEEQK